MERKPELKTIRNEDQELAVWEWAGEGPLILFAHATGFHGRCWDRIIAEFPGRQCLAVDARGHGRSSKPEPPCHWRAFGRDLAAIAQQWDIRGAIGVGHSMGGHITTQVAALRPETYRGLLLVDPTIFPLDYYGTEPPDAHFTLRRRNTWNSPEEMFERFRNRVPFVNWRPEILRDYCEYGLLPQDGEFVLACPPPVEASIYLNSKEPGSNIYPEIATVQHPVVVMRAGKTRNPEIFDLSASPTAPDLASKFANGREVVLEAASHYIPMEWPEMVVEEIRALEAATAF
ncbi:MAG: alpha/beta hydrolase fold [Candidatus Solibacter sp.]|nr:alpha/beta hydrolase fold [Candidatus Solibacter sp.]